MTMELIASGREADVFALDEQRVLRRHRQGASAASQARLLRHLWDAGYPVPEVFDVDGGDLVLRRLSGPTMLEAVLTGEPVPGAVLAELHDRLHALPAPDWLPRHPSGGDRIVHLDLHPGNVILTEAGAVVIDWTNAAAGEPAADVADTLVTLTVANLEGVDMATVLPQRDAFIADFLDHAAHDPAPRLAQALRLRLNDPNFGESERDQMRSWLDRLAAA